MADILRPNMPTDDLERDLLASQLREGNFSFAGGVEANNHLDMGYYELGEHLQNRLVRFGGELLHSHGIEFSFIATVPTGGDGYGQPLAEYGTWAYTPEVMQLQKYGTRKFGYTDESSWQMNQLIKTYGRPKGIVVDDASSDGGTGEALADHLSEDAEITLVMSMFYRGDLRELVSKYRRAVVAARNIPLLLDWKAYYKEGTIKQMSA